MALHLVLIHRAQWHQIEILYPTRHLPYISRQYFFWQNTFVAPM
jgi:hypothetical protein